MEVLTRGRASVRRMITRLHNEIFGLCGEEEPDLATIDMKLKTMLTAKDALLELDLKVVQALAEDENSTEDQQDDEYLQQEEYQSKFEKARMAAEKVLYKQKQPSPTPSEASFATGVAGRMKKTYKLPKIEIKKFNGDILEWLGFWAQFSKIHEDQELTNSDKFQYLVQSMSKGSRAMEVVCSYPQSSENYEKAISALKRRFGRDTLLVEVYVRELIKMVINITSEKGRVTLSQMFDKLESHLRALDSLGVTSDKCAAILFPLVESCLPEETLKAWHRSPLSKKEEEENDPKTGRLHLLMEFLREEVEGEERITLARQGFSLSKKQKSTRDGAPEDFPTAHGLVAGEDRRRKCIFCGNDHESPLCVTALDMSSDEITEKVKIAKVCFTCLRSNHQSKGCRAVVKCAICSKKHHTVTCRERVRCEKKKQKNNQQRRNGDSGKGNSSEAEPEGDNTSHEMASQTSGGAREVLLQTLMVKILNGDQEKVARVIIDTGSQRTYIKKSLAEEMNYTPVGEEEIQHVLFGGAKTGTMTHRKYAIQLMSLDGKKSISLTAVDNEKICGRLPRLSKGLWLKELSEKRIWISDYGQGAIPEIEILIGSDAYHTIITGKVHKLKSGLVASETVLGWTLNGPLPGIPESISDSVASVVTSMHVSDKQMADLWDLEAIGIKEPMEIQRKEERELMVKEHFKRTVTSDNEGRYQVSLPWVGGKEVLPSNRSVAEDRLVKATKKLKDNSKYGDYEKVFDGWLKEGIIEEVSSEETANVHYLPHRAIFKDSKTTPVRPVYDASCKVKRYPSLNDCLEKGENLLEVIPSLLLRFRAHRIGVISDIRKAFLMISISPEDRDYVRFLWWSKENPEEVKVYRHKRVVFGLKCSPFLLGAVIEHHLDKVPEELRNTAAKLLKSLYVDNCVTSVKTPEELNQFVKESTAMMASAKMDLRMWECTAGDNFGIDSSKEEDLESVTSVLGVKWNKVSDSLYCDVPEVDLPEKITKRVILSAANKIFDPLGFLTPVTLLPKMLLQEAWKLKVGWNDQLPENISDEFRGWTREIKADVPVMIPRWMSQGETEPESMELHVFCDASKYAYASVIYLRSEFPEGVTVQLVQSKTRVRPIGESTIPRLELMACFIGARLAESVKKALGWESIRTVYWSDSTTAIAWIKRNGDWGTFVGNRVRSILKTTNPDDWRLVPGVTNPADVPYRGCSMKTLLDLRWWEGPKWMSQPEQEWPGGEFHVNEEIVNEERMKTAKVNASVVNRPPWYSSVTNSYSKLVRLVAWMLRAFRPIQDESVRKVFVGGTKIPELTVKELDRAEKAIIKMIQKESFKDEKEVSNVTVFRDEAGILRVETKITRRQDSYDFTHPILLPAKHPLVKNMIDEIHWDKCHAGVQTLMNHLRQRFWIVRSRQIIRIFVSRCTVCQRFSRKKMNAAPAALPEYRSEGHEPFEVTGVDLCGPIYLRSGEEQSKAWIVLYTCAYFRAIHLDLVSSASTASFLQSLQRFVSVRGRPRIICSDNGTNFKGADSALRKLDWSKIEREAALRQIQWKFSCPSAPWWGGWWERLIGMTKKLLVRVLGRAKLNYEEMMTQLYRVAAVVNERPLTYVSDGVDDLSPLTPAHFLQGVSKMDMRDVDELERVDLGEEHRHQQKLKQSLRQRFRDEYLSQLVQRGKEKATRPVKVGDLVLVQRDDQKRIMWPSGRVVEIFPGRDGIARMARIKTEKGSLLRPVQKLYLMEINAELPEEMAEKIAGIDSGKDGILTTKSGRQVKVPDRFSY